jgi:DNA helicase-2/ATP-dependent DNA helicase PcrA
MSSLLTGLNPEQHAAVIHGSGPLLVLAGAGSGKTRVITHRIAYLIERGVRPWQILAVTFTNKAAGEMLERVRSLAGEAANDAWVSTFHAMGVRILRRDGYKIGLPRHFTIFDTSDQLSLMKRVAKELDFGDDELTPRDALDRIDGFKNLGIGPDDVQVREDDALGELVQRAYRRYEDSLKAQGAVDFGDLLLRVVELFKASPDTREYYQRRFVHILVDEFQDTNPVQYELLKLLCPENRRQANLCVVGDDDQSIYRWRGADVGNILGFPKDFPGAGTVKLERNYRSTPSILDAAHAVISQNKARAPKKLWTEGDPGDKLEILVTMDDRGEASRVAERIYAENARGTEHGEIAVFYRTNAQSRVLEEALRTSRIPYVIVRGQSFYDRAEIRDISAYLRLIVNPRSDNDFLRAIGSPPRGIGDTTLERLGAYASGRGISLWEATGELDSIEGINSGIREKIRKFRDQIAGLSARTTDETAHGVVQSVVKDTGFLERLKLDLQGEDRVQNVQEFVRAAKEFDLVWEQVVAAPARAFEDVPSELVPRAGVVRQDASAFGQFGQAQYAALQALRGDADQPAPSALEAFLAQVAVLGDADAGGEPNRVSLMTLHAAKGLEFDVVFLTGMEEGVFPTTRSIDDDDAIAEERRLCYVGLTRARKRVFLTLSRQRSLYGELKMNAPSRFLREIPPTLVNGLNQINRPAPSEGLFGNSQQWGGREWSKPPPRREDRGGGYYVERESDAGASESFERGYRPPPRLMPPKTAAVIPGMAPSRPGEEPLKRGTQVRHTSFGVGKVLASQGAGPMAKLTVDFPKVGPKVVVAKYVQVVD